MKKLTLILTIFAALMCTACEDPKDFADNHDVEFVYDHINAAVGGGTYTADIKTNVRWKVVEYNGNITSVSPMSGNGNGTLSINLTENTDFKKVANIIVLQMDEPDRVVNQTFVLRVDQAAIDAVISADITQMDIPCCGGYLTINISSNAAWKLELPAGLTSETVSGELDGSFKVKYAENMSTSELIKNIVVSSENDPQVSVTIKLTQEAFTSPTYIDYEGDQYKVMFMDDNRWWFAQNMRYIPEGKTPSTDAANVTGIWNPVVFSLTASEVVFYTDPADIRELGYIYDLRTATAGASDQITSAENLALIEKVRGICPEGWYLPTSKEVQALSVAHPNDPASPLSYRMSITGLTELGFWQDVQGCVMISNSTAAPALNRVGYWFTSTIASYALGTGATEGRITLMMSCIMQNRTAANDYLQIANGSAFNGAGVRCVKMED